MDVNNSDSSVEGGWAQPRPRKRWLPYFMLVAVMLVGLFLRVEDFSCWRAARETTFFQNKPLLGALDGYYYLRLSRDLLEHTYTPNDPMRNAPDGYHRPAVPPMLSCLAAGVCRVTGWQLDWVGFFLPAFLGTLMAIPLFAFGRYLSCSAAGIAAALAGMVAPYVIYRGGMGWFDTDCLNVTWTLATAYCFMRFSHGSVTVKKVQGSTVHGSGGNAATPSSSNPSLSASSAQSAVSSSNSPNSAIGYRQLVPHSLGDGGSTFSSSVAWLLAGLVFTGLFLWWWDQAAGAVLIISLIPLLIGLGFFYRPRSRTEVGALVILVLSITILAAINFQWFSGQVANWFTAAESQIRHVTKQAQSNLPNFALSISEQAKPSFSYVIDSTTRSLTVFIISVLGFLSLAMRKTKVIVFLLPTVALGILAVTCSERFLIFLTPLLALGFGNIIGGICQLNWLHRGFGVVAVAVLSIALFPPVHVLLTAATAWPKTEASRVAGIVKLASTTPTNAVIWTLWDNGYAVNYFARRATISDGQIHGAELARYEAIPMTTTNPVLAARFMHFYAAHGQSGVQAISPAAVNDPASYPVTPNGRPVYLFLDSMTLSAAPIWFASVNPVTNGPTIIYQPIFDLVLKDDGVYNPQGLVVNTDEGILHNGKEQLALTQLVAREDKGAWIQEYSRTNGGCFEFVVSRKFGVLMNQELTESVFNRLFVRLDPKMGKWFEPIVDRSPEFQIWKVLGL